MLITQLTLLQNDATLKRQSYIAQKVDTLGTSSASQQTTSTAPPATTVPQTSMPASTSGVPSTASTVNIIPAVGDQVKQIYDKLQRPGALPVANTDWEKLWALVNCTLPLAIEIGLKLLINVTAEDSNQVLVCNDNVVMQRCLEIFNAGEVKMKETVAWLLSNLATSTSITIYVSHN
jgi:hypothetical protein